MSSVLFSGDVASLNEKEIEELLGSLKVKLEAPKTLLDLLIAVGAATSKTQARTFVEQKGVLINGTLAEDPNRLYGPAETLCGKYFVIRRGKKNYFLAEL